MAAWAAARFLRLPADCPPSERLVVLAGASAYRERTDAAARLFAAGAAPRVVLTNDGERGGWSAAERRNPFFVERSGAELQASGVPLGRMDVLPDIVNSTYDEAVLLRRYAERTGVTSLLLVTSPYHGRRARWTYDRVFAGSDVRVHVCAVATSRDAPGAATWWLSARGWREVSREYLKFSGYLVRYGRR